MKSNFIIVENKYNEGRCVHCDARDFCSAYPRQGKYKCQCNYGQHYKDIYKERKLKLEKLNEYR